MPDHRRPRWSGVHPDALVDLRVTPAGGFQVVGDESTTASAGGADLHQTSYRIFDPAGAPLTDEIVDAGYFGDDPPVRLPQSSELDDATVLKVDTVYNTSGPGSKMVRQLYDQSGTPVGDPICTAYLNYGKGGIAQLPNRDIVFLGDTRRRWATTTSTPPSGVPGPGTA